MTSERFLEAVGEALVAKWSGGETAGITSADIVWLDARREAGVDPAAAADEWIARQTESRPTTTFIAEFDLKGHEMERPFLRAYVEGEDEAQALAAAERIASADESVRRVVPLQPILDDIRSRPDDFSLSWKSEGRQGPVTLTDRAKVPEGQVQAIPFGSDPEWLVALPWSTRAEARRLAKYLGVGTEEW